MNAEMFPFISFYQLFYMYIWADRNYVLYDVIAFYRLRCSELQV